MGQVHAFGLCKLILVFGLIKKTIRNYYEGEHLCAKLKQMDFANCSPANLSSLLHLFLHEAH